MGQILEEAIAGAVRDFSTASFVNLWGTIILAGLSTCALIKILVILGYLAVLKLSDWKRLLANVLIYVLGMGFSYLLMGLLIVNVPSLLRALVSGSSILYFVTGISLVAFGILALGIFRIPIDRIKLLSREYPEHDYLVAFLLGAVLVAMEALSCPTCNPALKSLLLIYEKQGPLFALSVSGTLFLGQSTLPLVAGIVVGPLKTLLANNDNYEYVQIAGAIILVLVGTNLLWLF